MWNAENAECVAFNPLRALERASEGQSVVEGLVPKGGVSWLYGPSMSFKSFITMGMAAAVSTGSPWLGRRTHKSAVVYVGAEGGDGLHVRRAAAELACAANVQAALAVVQERPMLDRERGLFALRGILAGAWLAADSANLFDDAVTARVEAMPAVAEARAAYVAAEAALTAAEVAVAACTSGAGVRLEGAAVAYRDAETALLEARAEAERGDALLREYAAGFDACGGASLHGFDSRNQSLLCIIDTYSQTAEDDDRRSVSAYVKHLRTLIEEAQAQGVALSFLVVDHVTKEGSTYLGSVAKLNDVDSQIEVTRLRKSMLATITQTKSKDDVGGAVLNAELVPFEIPGFRNAAGAPLATLVVRDGPNSTAATAVNPEGNAAMLVEMLQGAGGRMPEAELKAAFRQVKIVTGVKPESADKAFRRAMQALQEDGVRVADGDVSLV